MPVFGSKSSILNYLSALRSPVPLPIPLPISMVAISCPLAHSLAHFDGAGKRAPIPRTMNRPVSAGRLTTTCPHYHPPSYDHLSPFPPLEHVRHAFARGFPIERRMSLEQVIQNEARGVYIGSRVRLSIELFRSQEGWGSKGGSFHGLADITVLLQGLGNTEVE